jgi:hypothetical protein
MEITAGEDPTVIQPKGMAMEFNEIDIVELSDAELDDIVGGSVSINASCI